MFGFLGKLLGGSSDGQSGGGERVEADSVEYSGFSIVPAAARMGGHWQVAATIKKEIDGELQRFELIRADTHTDVAECQNHALQKAKRVIDEQGDKLFS